MGIPTIPIHRTPFALIDTDHSYQRATLLAVINTPIELRVSKVAGALFYTYMWGWYTGFIEMPYYSIQGLLSNPPVSSVGGGEEVARSMQKNQEKLRQYRLLASLFADESDSDFASTNFGFLTPPEAYDRYVHSFDARFNDYFGRALAEFLDLVPGRYR